MVSNGNRIRITRLIALFAVGLLCLSVGLAFAWFQLTSSGKSTPSDRKPTIATTGQKDSGAVESSEKATAPHALDPVLSLARQALQQHRKRDNDYTAVMSKRERVGGKLMPQSKMEIKLRYSPLADAPATDQNFTQKRDAFETSDSPADCRHVSVYLKFIEPKSQAGREAIWVQDANEGNLIVHETGMLNLLRAKLAPDSTLAMMGNKYPVTEIGLEKLLMKLIERGERDKQYGPCEVSFIDDATLGERKCKLIEVRHPKQEESIDGAKVRFEFHLAQIYIDTELMLPIRYASYLWPTADSSDLPLEEEYTYENIQLNVGLTDSDFDPDNKEYNYP